MASVVVVVVVGHNRKFYCFFGLEEGFIYQ